MSPEHDDAVTKNLKEKSGCLRLVYGILKAVAGAGRLSARHTGAVPAYFEILAQEAEDDEKRKR